LDDDFEYQDDLESGGVSLGGRSSSITWGGNLETVEDDDDDSQGDGSHPSGGANGSVFTGGDGIEVDTTAF
jgi:hypothetical protein